MLNERIKALRKEKGLTQEELAIRLNVVRQTVSKWEKGLSVPDADLLIRLAEVFECPVSRLLGEEEAQSVDTDKVAQQLSRINEQLAVKNRRARRVWKVLGILLAILLLIQALLLILGYAAIDRYTFDTDSAVEVVEAEETLPD